MATTGPDESRDDLATLKSVVEEATDDLDRKFDSSEGSVAALVRWRKTANLLRTIRTFNYLQEDPPDEALPEIQRTRIRTLSVKSRSTGADESEEREADLYLETAETEDEVEQEHLKPCA